MTHTLEVLDQIAGKPEVEVLVREYLTWALPLFNEQNDLEISINGFIEKALSDLPKFLPPHGCAVLARNAQGTANAIGFFQEIRPDAVEIKRLFVRPDARGERLGQRLVLTLIDQARTRGFSQIYLDTADFMSSAHSLYRSLGFCDIDGYPEAEHQREESPHVLYMVMTLD